MKQITLFDLAAFTNSTVAVHYNPSWDEEEPPDPDDYPNLEEYHEAWDEWEREYPQLVSEVRAMSDPAPEQVQCVREQVKSDTVGTLTSVREQLESAPEHTHWLEEYWVKRCGKKYKYWRYCWMSGRKIKRCHIGGVRSPLAAQCKLAVEDAISEGRSPQEIQKLIHS